MRNQLSDPLYHLLKWCKQHVHTDLTYLTHNGFWLSLNKLVMAGSGLILILAMANWLTPATFGTYKFILAGSGILGSLALTGLGPAITRSVARGYEGNLGLGVKTYLKWSLGLTLSGLAVAGYYFFAVSDLTLAISFVLIGFVAPWLSGLNLFQYWLTGKKSFDPKL